MTEYILPNLYPYQKTEEDRYSFLIPEKRIDRIQSLDDFIGGNWLILAEPGNGKTRLLQEIKCHKDKHNKPTQFIELRSLSKQSSLEEYLETYKINVNEIDTICFDALDEVSNTDFFNVLDLYKRFLEKHPAIKAIMSCRSYLYDKVKAFLNFESDKVIEINDLTLAQVRMCLEKEAVDPKYVQQITEYSLSFQGNIFLNPRVLNIFIDLIKTNRIEDLLSKSKGELFDIIITAKLDIEDSKNNSDLKDITKRTLEKLALVMSIDQVTEISRDELISFFDNIESNLSLRFLGSATLDTFYTKTVLNEKEGRIRFENLEFQEYLAAKELSRFSNLDQLIFDIIVDQQLKEINQNWNNIVNYLIDLKPSLQISLITYFSKIAFKGNIEFVNYILSANISIINSLKEVSKKIIFSKVLDIFGNQHYLNIAQKIAEYYTASCDSLLTEMIHSKDPLTKLNGIYILEYLLPQYSKSQADTWIRELAKELDINAQRSLNSQLIKTIGSLKDLSLLVGFKDSINEIRNNDVTYTYIYTCNEIDPNNPFVIDLIFDFYNDLNHHLPSITLKKITSQAGIIYSLKKILEEPRKAKLFSTNEYEIENLKTQVELNYSSEVEDLLLDIIFFKDFYFPFDSFSTMIGTILKEKNETVIFKVVKKLKEDNNFNNYSVYSYLSTFLTPSNAEEVINQMKVIPEVSYQLVNLFYSFIRGTSIDKEIYNIGNRFFHKEFMEIENLRKEDLNQNLIYERYLSTFSLPFKAAAADQKPYFIFVLKDNLNNFLEFLTEGEKEEMKSLVTDYISKFKFESSFFYLAEDRGQSKSFSIDNGMLCLLCAIGLIKPLGLNSSDFRSQIIKSIPYSFSNNLEHDMFSMIPNLNQNEIDEILFFYSTERKDDLFHNKIDVFFELCQYYKLTLAAPNVKNVILDSSYDIHYRIKALSTFKKLSNDIDSLYEIYASLGHLNNIEKDEFKLCSQINADLILSSHTKRNIAILDRIGAIKIKRRKYKSDLPNVNEIAFDEEHFNGPLLYVNDISLIDSFLQLLETSNELIHMDKDYESYAYYLIGTCIKYIDNLKSHKNYSPLIMLNKYIDSHLHDSHIKSYLDEQYRNLKVSYAKEVTKSGGLISATNMYNFLKSQQYISIRNSEDLLRTIEGIIDDDLRIWVESEGAYKLIKNSTNQEVLIQKTIKTQFENALLKKGFRKQDISIRREVNLLDDKRPDFLISYGFVGPIIVEIKLSKNPELQSKKQIKYRPKLKQYISGTYSDYGIFLIMQIDEKNPIEPILFQLHNVYQNDSEIRVIGMNCISNTLDSAN